MTTSPKTPVKKSPLERIAEALETLSDSNFQQELLDHLGSIDDSIRDLVNAVDKLDLTVARKKLE